MRNLNSSVPKTESISVILENGEKCLDRDHKEYNQREITEIRDILKILKTPAPPATPTEPIPSVQPISPEQHQLYFESFWLM